MPFRKYTPILYYNPRPAVRWSRRRYFLYPVRMYRVVAPRVSSRKLNILEKAVLGMCRAGVMGVAEIGSHLDIGKDLAALIITQLSDQDYVDSRGMPTPRGLETLEGETFITQDATAGFVFQDPWTGDLFPRFEEREAYADVRFNHARFPELILGTTGKPDYQQPFMPLFIQGTAKMQPSPIEILNAVQQHRRTLRNSSRIRDDDDEIWASQQLPALDRISFIDEEPSDLWLATCLYLPEKGLSANTWNVCDPFGLGDSPLLRRRLEKHIREQTIPKLQSLLMDLLGEQREESINLDDWLNLADREAGLKVEYKLTPAIRKWEELFEDLVAVERAYIEAQELIDSKILLDKLKDILVKSQIAAERLFKVLQKEHPTKGYWKRISERREHNREPLNRFAQNAGFIEPLPEGLLSVDRKAIRKAADDGNGSLRALMLTALLATPDNSAHPLRLASQRHPDLLHLLDQLAQKRNSYAGHATSQYATAQPLELSDITQQIDTVYKLVAATLQLSYQP
ncbi:hypothetical protein H6F96_00200 [Microcoleus sp. FACHB-53]|nr:hypothetical protein [Microcoleus sp. FACHB-53]